MAFRALSARLLLQPALDRVALRIGLRVFPERWLGASLLQGFERLLARVPGLAGARGAVASETQVGPTLLEAGFRSAALGSAQASFTLRTLRAIGSSSSRRSMIFSIPSKRSSERSITQRPSP